MLAVHAREEVPREGFAPAGAVVVGGLERPHVALRGVEEDPDGPCLGVAAEAGRAVDHDQRFAAGADNLKIFHVAKLGLTVSG